MSYEIVYAREFIKTGDERIIPLVLTGSNNCWGSTYKGRWKRERHWTALLAKQGANPAFIPEELMQEVRSYVPSEYQEHFVRNGKWVNDDAFVRFFKNGIEKAKKLEELYEELLWPVSLEGTVYYYDDRHNDKTLHSVNIKSTLDLDDFLEDVDKLISENTDERKLYISISFNYDDVLQRRKIQRPKKKRLNEFYAVTTGRGYVSRITRLGVYYTSSKNFAKQFDTQRQAEKWVKDRELERRFPKLTFGIEYVA